MISPSAEKVLTIHGVEALEKAASEAFPWDNWEPEGFVAKIRQPTIQSPLSDAFFWPMQLAAIFVVLGLWLYTGAAVGV